MVKLTRILKSEYRDDVLSKRSSRRKKRLAQNVPPEPEPELPAPELESMSPVREELKLPPALLKILQSHTGSHHSDREDRDPSEAPLSPTSTNGDPHHFALTRAAQMTLAAMPESLDLDAEDDRSNDASTMAMIDSIVKTSDDPALIEAIKSMMGDGNSQSQHQRETLALVADSIMEKRAAKEAVERAVLAESRLHESLKRHAPEIGNDAASAVLEACEASVAASAGNNGGFFQRINKTLTGTSQSSNKNRRGLPKFVKQRTKGHKKSSKNKNKNKSGSKAGNEEAPIVLDSSTGVEDVEHASDEPVFLMSTQPFTPTKEESEKDVSEEGRDDQEDSRSEPDDSVTKSVTKFEEDMTTPSVKRKNKYKHITSIEPSVASRVGSRSRKSRSSSRRSRNQDNTTLGSTLGQSTVEAMNNWTAGQWSAYIGHGTTATSNSKSNTSGSGVSTSGDDESETLEDGSDSDSDTGTNELTDDENLRLELTNEGDDEPKKIEYTIFELESNLSMSTVDDLSSVCSPSSAGDTYTDDHETDFGTDYETLDTRTSASGAATEDEDITFVEGDLTYDSGDTGEDESEASDFSQDEDEENTLLFSLFCQRPGEESDDEEDSHDRRSRRRKERKQERQERKEKERQRRHRRDEEESASLLKCVSGAVSGYFGGSGDDGDADVEVFLDDKKKRRRRRRRHRD